MKFLNIPDIMQVAIDNSIRYQNASPFPHIVLDNIFELTILREIAQEFPSMRDGMRGKSNKTTQNKLSFRQPEKLSLFARQTKSFSEELNGTDFCKFLETLTGIMNIKADPMLEGGGPHEILQGGFLKMHVDFNIHPETNYDRRINVLIYLNEDWQDSYLGHLDLWDTEMGSLKKKILPIMNRMVIFNTTENSWHGHPDPLNCPKDRSRRSLAFYYYTEPVSDQIRKGHSTIYKPRTESDY